MSQTSLYKLKTIGQEWIMLIYCLLDWCTLISSKKDFVAKVMACLFRNIQAETFSIYGNMRQICQYKLVTLHLLTRHQYSLLLLLVAYHTLLLPAINYNVNCTTNDHLQKQPFSVHVPSNKKMELQRLDFYKPLSGQVTCPPLSDCHKI